MKYLKYIIAFFIIVIPSVVTVLIYNDKITEDSPMYYKKGVEYYNQGNYPVAYSKFLKIKWISPLYPIALYKQAKSAQKIGDYTTATLKYEAFLEKTPDSIFAKTAKFNLGKCYFYLKKYPEAKTAFINSKTNPLDKGAEDYYIGLIEKKTDKVKAAEYFKNYISYETENDKPNEIIAAEELSSLDTIHTIEDYILLGKVYYKNKKYTKAIEYFSKVPIASVWDYLVLANHYAGNKVIARKLMESGMKLYSDKISEENLHSIYDIYVSYMKGTKLKNWNKLLTLVRAASVKGEDYVMYKLATFQSGEKALALYNEIQDKYPNSKFAPESLWNVFWDSYRKGNYTKAEELAYKHIKQYRNVKSTTRIAFWLAKTELKLNKINEANHIFSKLASKYPDDYYGLRASYILSKKDDFWTTNVNSKLPEKKEELGFPITLSKLDIKDLKLINTLFEMGDYGIWLDAQFDNKLVESWFEQRKEKTSRSIVLARNAIEEMDIKPAIDSVAYKLAYPKYWVEEINIAGQKLNLDPYLIISLIREESYFNPEAVSSTNAVGLMQIMPSTANYLVSLLKVDISTVNNLKSPRVNMYLGCNYLKYLRERFNNNDLYVIAAYNGGEGSVDKWRKKYSTSDNDEFIENIPFDETRNYVKKIFRTYHMYKNIYK